MTPSNPPRPVFAPPRPMPEGHPFPTTSPPCPLSYGGGRSRKVPRAESATPDLAPHEGAK
jgi:hypothetical protein